VVRVATLAVGVAIGAILAGAAVLFLGPWWVPATRELVPPVPKLSSDGPVVRNGVAAIVACGKKRGFEVVSAAPEPRTGTWGGREEGWVQRLLSPPSGRDPARGTPPACAGIR
jgi:hypothetical protein